MLATVFQIACNRAGADFEQAARVGTPKAYEAFLAKHPDGAHAIRAREQLERLLWTNAEKADSASAYERYVKAFPKGPQSQLAARMLSETINLPFSISAAGQWQIDADWAFSSSSVRGVAIKGTIQSLKVDGHSIPLASGECRDGDVTTKEFGKLKLTASNPDATSSLLGALHGSGAFIWTLSGSRTQKEAIQTWIKAQAAETAATKSAETESAR